MRPWRLFTNYVTHFLLFFDHPPTHSNALAIISLMTYNAKVCYSNAFANHPPSPAALRNLWMAPLLSWPFKSPLRLLLWQLCGFLTMSFPSGLMSLTTHKTWENWIAFNAWYMDGQLKNFSQSFTEKPNQKFKHQNLTFESSFLTILIIIVFLLVFLRFVERIRTALLVPNWGGEEGRNCVAAFLASPPNMSV